MVGQHRGLVSRLAVKPGFIVFHCIIHKSVLWAILCREMKKKTTNTVTRLINFVPESSSLQHRLFRALLDEMSAEYTDLLLHNDVHWLRICIGEGV